MNISGAGWASITIISLAIVIGVVILATHDYDKTQTIDVIPKKIECAIILKDFGGGESVKVIELETHKTCKESIISKDDLELIAEQ